MTTQTLQQQLLGRLNLIVDKLDRIIESNQQRTAATDITPGTLREEESAPRDASGMNVLVEACDVKRAIHDEQSDAPPNGVGVPPAVATTTPSAARKRNIPAQAAAINLRDQPPDAPTNGGAPPAEATATPSAAPKRDSRQSKERPKKKKRGDHKKKKRGGGLNAYNIFKSYMKHRLTNGTPLGLEEYVRVYFADPRTYADKHMKSIYKDSDRTALNLNDVFQTWKRSQSDTWGGRETNVLKVNAFLNAKWGDLSDAEKQPYQDALAALLTRRHKRPGQQEDEVVPSKKGGTFYSNEAKEDIVRKIQAAKEADPKQTFRKLCKEQNISVRNFYRWKKKLRGVELPPLPPPSPSIIPELPPLPPPSPSIIPELPPLPPPSPSIIHD